MKRRGKIITFAAMLVVAVGGTITGVAHAAAPVVKCDKFIAKKKTYKDGKMNWVTDAEGRPRQGTLDEVSDKQGVRGKCQ
jgi:hypothetical protein